LIRFRDRARSFIAFFSLVLGACTSPRRAPVVEIDVDRLPKTDRGLPGAGPIRREPWFRDLWEERHAQWAARVDSDRGAVVFAGDSITQNWGDDLGGSFADLKVANRGIGGDTTRGVLVRLSHDVLRLQPRAVVILAGTNDIELQVDVGTIAGNMDRILTALEASDPAMPIVLCELFPSSASEHRPRERIADVNRRYADLAKAHPRVTLVPTWAIFANERGDASLAEFPDLLHPNEAGYRRWASALRPVLAQVLATRPAPVRAAPSAH